MFFIPELFSELRTPALGHPYFLVFAVDEGTAGGDQGVTAAGTELI